MKNLIDIGFEHVGNWHLSESGLRLSLENLEDAAPALYAFVLLGDVMYVGKTKRTLRARLYGYLKGSGTQRTNIRVRGKILEALRATEKVEILGFRDSQPKTVGRFKVNLPAGLEDDIISQLHPPWNGGRESRTDGEDAEKPGEGNSQASPPLESLHHSKMGGTSEVGLRPSFIVTIGKTYYRQGFFNVPVDYERYFAGDGATVAIELPGTRSPTQGKINRSANLSHTPRMMGGTKLRDWLQQNVRMGGQVRVVVHGPKQIEIIPV